MRSELFERDVYSCQGEAERRSTQQTLQAVLGGEEKENEEPAGERDDEIVKNRVRERGEGEYSPVCTS